MKLILSVLMIAVGIVRASGDAVSCSVIDYLYYSSDCCDGSKSVQCMESIPQTDKAAIDNLASLKRPEGTACGTGDTIKFLNSKIVCTTADSCLIPCVNGNITGSESTSCACACNAGFSGVDCSTADPTTTPAPAATTTTTLAPAASYSVIKADTLCNDGYSPPVMISVNRDASNNESQEDHLARCKSVCDANADCRYISKSTDSCWTTNQATCNEVVDTDYTTYVK